MDERAEEREQSQRRVAELEQVLGAYGSERRLSLSSPLRRCASCTATSVAVARGVAIASARAAALGTPPKSGQASDGAVRAPPPDSGVYTQRLAQLVDENSALRKENEQLRKMY